MCACVVQVWPRAMHIVRPEGFAHTPAPWPGVYTLVQVRSSGAKLSRRILTHRSKVVGCHKSMRESGTRLRYAQVPRARKVKISQSLHFAHLFWETRILELSTFSIDYSQRVAAQCRATAISKSKSGTPQHCKA